MRGYFPLLRHDDHLQVKNGHGLDAALEFEVYHPDDNEGVPLSCMQHLQEGAKIFGSHWAEVYFGGYR